jgi:hypothetical protein
MERSSRADSRSGRARKSSRSTQGIHTRLLSDDRSVVELRRKKRMKVSDIPALSSFKSKEYKNTSHGASPMAPNELSGPGAELVGRSLLVFCGLSFPGMDSEAVRWHQCKVLDYHETDRTHDVLWGDFGMKSSHISFYTGSDYCIFKDRGVAS